jgi:hypothetical protein
VQATRLQAGDAFTLKNHELSALDASGKPGAVNTFITEDDFVGFSLTEPLKSFGLPPSRRAPAAAASWCAIVRFPPRDAHGCQRGTC